MLGFCTSKFEPTPGLRLQSCAPLPHSSETAPTPSSFNPYEVGLAYRMIMFEPLRYRHNAFCFIKQNQISIGQLLPSFHIARML